MWKKEALLFRWFRFKFIFRLATLLPSSLLSPLFSLFETFNPIDYVNIPVAFMMVISQGLLNKFEVSMLWIATHFIYSIQCNIDPISQNVQEMRKKNGSNCLGYCSSFSFVWMKPYHDAVIDFETCFFSLYKNHF